jgi:4-hydroxy-tetrahydrodipicolinate reductase
MKIALIGYGKMGKMIEEEALKRNHQIILRIDIENRSTITVNDLKKCDVAIEFTSPQSAIQNIKWCIDAELPVVVGTTGWYEQIDEIKAYCTAKNGSVLYASNFSVGVNIFFALNEYLARIMNNYPQYNPLIEEIHHQHKLDAPSGTAISIAQGIINNLERKKSFVNQYAQHSDQLSVISYRQGEVPGTHIVKYQSEIDDIEIKHQAHNRKGFALGAVIAAEWLLNKKGFFTINQVYRF